MNINEVVQIPFEQRDQTWENNFFQALTQGKVRLMSADPQVGPDKWPYILAETSEDANEPAQNLLHWLYTRGIGLVINPQKDYPDYVFSYGMIWSFKETGFFHKPLPTELKNETIDFDPAQIKHAGTPTTAYLPNYVRSILKEFFRDQGILNPKILLISTDGLNYDLAFSTQSLGNPLDKELEGVAEAIAWFLPPHYSILLISEEGLPEFTAL